MFLLEKYNVDIYSKYIFDFEDDGYYFHGSRTGIKGDISPFFSKRETTDFSRGFYLGESFKQSSTFVAEENKNQDLIYRFSFDKEGLTGIELTDVDWILFIAYNRGKIPENKSTQKLINKMKRIINGHYDFISGDIADDKMSQNMEEFFADRLTYGQIMNCLTLLKVGKQYCLKTVKACERLQCTGIYRLDDAYRYLIKTYALSKRFEAVSEAKRISKKQDKNGMLFSELLEKYGNK